MQFHIMSIVLSWIYHVGRDLEMVSKIKSKFGGQSKPITYVIWKC